MIAASDPNLMVGGFAVGGLGLAALWRLIAWVRDAPARPDPWDAEVEQQLLDAAEACPRCSTPQPPNAWFCAHCGKAVGPYNNVMPYLQVFSEGEVFRNGTSGQFRRRPLILLGYFLLGFGMFSVLAPVYWLSLLLNLRPPGTAPKPGSEE